jgi:pimeloyl-ACP methyl ester carboxylesterase
MLEQSFNQNQSLLYRISGPPDAPVLIYIPGIHGDWTPMRRLQPLLSQRLRLVEVAYPRAPEWSLEDYTARLLDLFLLLDIGPAHLLAESFGSLIGLDFALHCPERVRSIVIAGGFCSSPGRLRVGLARRLLGLIQPRIFEWGIDLYLAWVIRGRLPIEGDFREDFFPASRTRRGWQAVLSRLDIIRRTDFRPRLARLRTPIFYLGGSRDWVVPVRRTIDLFKRCLHESCVFRNLVIPGAPHAILPACARSISGIITDWVGERQRQPDPQPNPHFSPDLQ